MVTAFNDEVWRDTLILIAQTKPCDTQLFQIDFKPNTSSESNILLVLIQDKPLCADSVLVSVDGPASVDVSLFSLKLKFLSPTVVNDSVLPVVDDSEIFIQAVSRIHTPMQSQAIKTEH